MTNLTGQVVLPGDPGWDESRFGFAARPDYDANVPKAVVYCRDATDVRHAILWARENRAPIRVRSGRHNYEGFSSLNKDGLIIDVSQMQGISASSEADLAMCGAGLDMLGFYEGLGAVGRAVPGATGPSVGLAGLTLGGGFGPTSRKWGLTCDSLAEVEMVLADGSIVRANKTDFSDLFWACQGGGGGNFGVATEFTFNTHKVDLVVIFSIGWTWDSFDAVTAAWLQWAPEAEDSLTASLMMYAQNANNTKYVTSSAMPLTLYGQFTPDSPADLGRIQELLAPMLATGPAAVQIQAAPYLTATRILLGEDPTQPMWRVLTHSDTEIFKSTSSFSYELFDAPTLALVKQQLESVPNLSSPPTEPSMIQFLPGGGAMGRVTPDATAAYPRKAKFVVQYNAYWNAPEDEAANIAWIEGFRNALLPYTKGAYVNYNDATLPNYLRQYYDANLEKLIEVKCKYDPDNVFNFPQSIPTSLPPGV